MSIIFLTLGLLCMSYLRVIHARKNGIFYAKGNLANLKDFDEASAKIKRWTKNIHIVTNQEYRAQYIGMFCFVMAVLIPHASWWFAILLSVALTQLASAIACYGWQKWINVGSGLPAIDPNEPSHYELTLFGKSYWIYKFWTGKYRPYISVISLITMLAILSRLLSI